ncbi:MAG: SPOR domain-containing protein [Bacteroidia bacterium]|nr:SPOR domain-containing protein [Bacteroidia bacterium]
MELSVEVYLASAFRELDVFALPKVGTFRKIQNGARIAEDSSVVFPPEIEIEFSPLSDAKLDLTHYLKDHIHIDPIEAEKIVHNISETILKNLKENGYFEVPKIGILKEDHDHILAFFTYHSEENVLADDFYGLKPVCFIQNNQLVLHQGETPTYMKNDYSAEKTLNFSSVGWKTFLLIALIFTLGFLVLNQGPFIKHRSSLDNGILAIRPLDPPRSFRGDFLTENPEDSISLALEESVLADAETDGLDGAARSSEGDQTLSPNPSSENTESTDTKLFSDNTNARLSQEELGTPRGQDLGNTRGVSSREGFGQVSNLSVLDTAKEKPNTRSTSSNTARLLSPVKNYHLITGSFGTLSAAQKFVNQLKQDGTDAIILFPAEGSGQTYRVSIYRNSDRSRVEEQGAKLEKLGQKPGWIFEER